MKRKVLDSCGNSGKVETPQAKPRRLNSRPAESEHLERSTFLLKNNKVLYIKKTTLAALVRVVISVFLTFQHSRLFNEIPDSFDDWFD